jgi:hypothetical protein
MIRADAFDKACGTVQSIGPWVLSKAVEIRMNLEKVSKTVRAPEKDEYSSFPAWHE